MSITDIKLQRSLQRVIVEGVANTHNIHPLHPDTQNIMIGSVIIAMYAWIESNTTPNWSALHDSNQAKPFQWISWDEFVNMHKIRHCFAHKLDGTILSNYLDDICGFQQKLVNNEIQDELNDETIVTVESYYQIEQGKIQLDIASIQRCMQITIKYYTKIEDL